MVNAGQRIITTQGTVRTVAAVINGEVYVYAPNGWLEKVTVRCDAWGGENDLHVAT